MTAIQRLLDLTLILMVWVVLAFFLSWGWTPPLGAQSPSANHVQSPSWEADLPSDPATSPGAVSGQVLDEKGGPIEGARIRVLRPGEDEPVQVTDSNDGGDYSFEGINPGLYILDAAHPGFETGRRIVMVAYEGNVTMDLTLQPLS